MSIIETLLKAGAKVHTTENIVASPIFNAITNTEILSLLLTSARENGECKNLVDFKCGNIDPIYHALLNGIDILPLIKLETE